MGYCLLYENMLPAILYARDKYLKSDTGLIVPSRAILRLAPFMDSEYFKDRFHFWDEQYGFDMTSMQSQIYEEIDVDHTISRASLLNWDIPFRDIDLYTVKQSELNFNSIPFTFRIPYQQHHLNQDKNAKDVIVHGFEIHFDCHFSPLPPNLHMKFPVSSQDPNTKTNINVGSRGPIGTHTIGDLFSTMELSQSEREALEPHLSSTFTDLCTGPGSTQTSGPETSAPGSAPASAPASAPGSTSALASGSGSGSVFTQPETHWRQGLCLIDRRDFPPSTTPLASNLTTTTTTTTPASTPNHKFLEQQGVETYHRFIRGSIAFRNSQDDRSSKDGLDVGIAWEIVQELVDKSGEDEGQKGGNGGENSEGEGGGEEWDAEGSKGKVQWSRIVTTGDAPPDKQADSLVDGQGGPQREQKEQQDRGKGHEKVDRIVEETGKQVWVLR